MNATTRRDADNKIVGVVGVAQDVTEAAKHDREVAAMANELRQLVDTANAPIFGKHVSDFYNIHTEFVQSFSLTETITSPLSHLYGRDRQKWYSE